MVVEMGMGRRQIMGEGRHAVMAEKRVWEKNVKCVCGRWEGSGNM